MLFGGRILTLWVLNFRTTISNVNNWVQNLIFVHIYWFFNTSILFVQKLMGSAKFVFMLLTPILMLFKLNLRWKIASSSTWYFFFVSPSVWYHMETPTSFNSCYVRPVKEGTSAPYHNFIILRTQTRDLWQEWRDPIHYITTLGGVLHG